MRRTSRTLVATAAAAALVGLPAVPAFAQGTPSTLSFEVSTEGDCTGVEFVGAAGVPQSQYVFADLTDDDGDGVYTGSLDIDPDDAEQVTEIRADGEVIHDAGTITVDEDTTVEADYSCDGAAPMPDTGGDAPAGVAVPGAIAAVALGGAGLLLLRRRKTS